MTENGNPDIIDQIEALTDDAASWSPADEHTRTGWTAPASGAMTAIALNPVGSGLIDISVADPASDIARHVGDPGVSRISHVLRVLFWVGDNSVVSYPVNTTATKFLHQLLVDIRDGHYIASDHERDHARALMAAPNELPVIHGPCLVTGVGDDGGPAPLNENFQSWFTTLLNEIAQRHESLLTAIAEEFGIPLEQIRQLTIIVLD